MTFPQRNSEPSRLKKQREQSGIAAAELARQVGVSRQTIYAVEDGAFIPNTLISLRLAKVLGCSVEDLFSLAEDTVPCYREAELMSAELPATPVTSQLVRVVASEGREVAFPLPSAFSYLPVADGMITAHAGEKVQVHWTRPPRSPRRESVLLAGCDPALSLLVELARPLQIEIVVVPCSSRQAVRWLAQGRVQIAGAHLLDQASGTYNVTAVRRAFPSGGVRVLTFAHWESGLLTTPGNPKRLCAIADLGRRNIRIVNREKGSGSRAQLDAGLKAAGIVAAQVNGYSHEVQGHLAAAIAVAQGWADCCLANRSAARCFGLNFIPLRAERFDLVIPTGFLASKHGEALADLLNRSALRAGLTTIAGYDTTHTGAVVI